MLILRRATLFFVVLVLLGPAGAWGQLPSNELEGTWKMVKQERVYPDSTVDYSDQWGPGYKIINSTHFSWGRETKDGSEVLAGGGWYEYYPEKDVYVEHIQYHSDPDLAGITLTFTARVDEDTWYHIGQVGNYKLREVWKRVDPETVEQRVADQDTTDATTTSESTAGSQ